MNLPSICNENETITGEEFMQILQAKKLVCEENASEDTTV